MIIERVDIADGKYTVLNDKGRLTALRYGEPWARDLVGDNLVYWMMVEIVKLRDENALIKSQYDSLASNQ